MVRKWIAVRTMGQVPTQENLFLSASGPTPKCHQGIEGVVLSDSFNMYDRSQL